MKNLSVVAAVVSLLCFFLNYTSLVVQASSRLPFVDEPRDSELPLFVTITETRSGYRVGVPKIRRSTKILCWQAAAGLERPEATTPIKGGCRASGGVAQPSTLPVFDGEYDGREGAGDGSGIN
ncbi:hypothetical protein Dimus_036321 [Dionaea muscipula]